MKVSEGIVGISMLSGLMSMPVASERPLVVGELGEFESRGPIRCLGSFPCPDLKATIMGNHYCLSIEESNRLVRLPHSPESSFPQTRSFASDPLLAHSMGIACFARSYFELVFIAGKCNMAN